jgi:cyclopropane-fatty-acyl-phospholipid synthase
MDGGYSLIAAPLRKLIHAVNRNTKSGSRRNIAAHYDLGNDFFRLFLDDTLMYSSAIFETPETSLKEASIAKLDLICRKLQLKPTDHLVEIGTGWGGFALHAAANYGCRITTTTISQNQFGLAQERIREAGLADRVTLLLEDYRELKGQYDKLVSIEMIEAVGHHYYDSFFRQCASLLKPDGAMLLQAITIADQQFASARDEVDFIKRYIFPGSCIPAITPLLQAATRASDLKLVHLEDIGPHYATTLNHWRQNFFKNIEEVRKLGYPDPFIRMWEFYLTYCEGGFIERVLGDVHMLFMKPLRRGFPPVTVVPPFVHKG